jgi:membrane peptidoglycan carboxypeptidase
MKPNYPGVTTKIYDRNGHLLAQIPSLQNRTPVSFNQISKWLKIATVDVEDKRFYEHGGVDYQGIARASSTTSRRATSCRAPRPSSSSWCATCT